MNKLAYKKRNGLTAILFLINLLFALVLCLTLVFSYQQHIRYAEERAANTTLALERSLSGMLDEINLILVAIQSELETQLNDDIIEPQKVKSKISHLVRGIPWLKSVLYSDSAGNIATDSGHPAGNSAINIQDRKYYQWLREHPKSNMVSSKPIIGRINNVWLIVYARPYHTPNGQFSGVVLATVTLDYFSDLFAGIKLSERSNIALINQDFEKIAAHPASDQSLLGQKIQPESIIRQMETGITSLSTMIKIKSDEPQHLYHFRKLVARPYWVMTALSLEDELAPWRQQAWLAFVVMLIFATLTNASSRQIQRGWRRQQDALSTLSATLEATDNGILVVDSKGKILHRNLRFNQMWHIPAKLANSKEDKLLLDHVMNQLCDPPGFIRGVQAAYDGIERELIDILEFKDGRVFERSSMPMRLGGKLNGRVWSFHDVSEQKRIETLLNFIAQRGWLGREKTFMPALAERLGQLLNVDYVLIDKLADEPNMAETVGLYSKGAVLPNFRYSLAGTPCNNVMGKELCIYKQSIQQLFPDDDLLVEMKAESYLGMPLWDSAGKPIGLIAILDSKPLSNTDQASALLKLVATSAGMELELQREEQFLRHERDRAQGYLDTVESMIVVLDRVGQISRINRKACQLLGWHNNELVGQSWFKLCLPQPEGLDKFNPYFLKMIAGKKDFLEFFESEITTRSGTRRTIAWHNAVLYDDDAQILGTLSAGEDITERKQRDAELETYRHNLEQLVDVRTTELVLAKDAAESANRAKSVFLANMSHELRTPLNAVLGFSNLLQHDTGMSEDSRKKLATINRSGQHLLALINDVLEISRIEAGRSVIELTPFNLSELLQDVEEMIRARADIKGLSFLVNHPINLAPIVLGDGPHLKQVLINLLDNAVKYTDRGSVSLTVNQHNGEIAFAITDTGLGICEEDQARLFQPFFQTEVGITKGEGTGLGLVISQEYTQLMGGHLGLQSQPDQGSTFTLSLSLPPCEAPSTKDSATGRIIGLEPGQRNVRVLVVDDKTDNRELLKLVLEYVGFEVLTANDGQQAVQAYQTDQPHFILMDMRMPVMDGYDATRKIRTLQGGDQVKIVALTASAFEEDRQKILDAGCNDLLSKPLNEEKLFALLSEMLGLRYSYEEKTTPPDMTNKEHDLSVLPNELLQTLKKATEALDVETTKQVIASIRETHPNLAVNLNKLMQNFRFDLIADMCTTAGV